MDACGEAGAAQTRLTPPPPHPRARDSPPSSPNSPLPSTPQPPPPLIPARLDPPPPPAPPHTPTPVPPPARSKVLQAVARLFSPISVLFAGLVIRGSIVSDVSFLAFAFSPRVCSQPRPPAATPRPPPPALRSGFFFGIFFFSYLFPVVISQEETTARNTVRSQQRQIRTYISNTIPPNRPPRTAI